ncbi:hypothetical protein LJB79_01395 [Bacteroides sp. OttesenSCG-928-M17]|nr:hypothetical protein [Bacteroides sp. OttesenSCG-928-M17]
MTTVVIDDSSNEGKAFIELLRKMKFARVLDKSDDWWDEISDGEREAIDKGLEDIKQGKTITHQQVKEQYEQWL